MQNGRIDGRVASLRELLAHMIGLYEAAWGGTPCWHEAEYYGLMARRRAWVWNSPLINLDSIT